MEDLVKPQCTEKGSEAEGVVVADASIPYIGIGTNITLGGKVKAAIHYDLIMWQPTLELDGRVVLDNGIPRVQIFHSQGGQSA